LMPRMGMWWFLLSAFNPLNAELNPICRLLALLGVHHFLHVSRIRVNMAAPPSLLCMPWSSFMDTSRPSRLHCIILFCGSTRSHNDEIA
jgi:hypothetical protein